MSNEDVKWISDVEEVDTLPLGTVITDYEGRQWDRLATGWGFAAASHVEPIASEVVMNYYGPVAVASLPLDADGPTEEAAYRDWFLSLSQARQDAILAETARLNEDAAAPAAVELRRTGMDSEQLGEVTDIVKDVMRNAHNIPQDQFPGHIALTLSRAGYHR